MRSMTMSRALTAATAAGGLLVATGHACRPAEQPDNTRPAAVAAVTATAGSEAPGAIPVAPGAWTTIEGAEVKLFRPRVVAGDGAPGLVLATEPALRVAATGSSVEIAEVQPAGGARMAAAAWCRGRGPRVGQRMV